jgi:hypothetical protein
MKNKTTLKDFLTSYLFAFVWCAIVVWEINPADWSETTRLIWMILGFVVFAMVHKERLNDEQ